MYFCSLKFNLLEAIVSIPKTIEFWNHFIAFYSALYFAIFRTVSPTWLILRFPFYVNSNFKVGSCVQIFYLLEKVFSLTANVQRSALFTTSLPSFSHILSLRRRRFRLEICHKCTSIYISYFHFVNRSATLSSNNINIA